MLIIGNGFDIIHGINVSFKKFVDSKEFQKNIGKTYKKYFTDDKYKEFSKTTKNLWSEFEEYCFHLVDTNQIKQGFAFMKKISLIFTKYWIERESTLNLNIKENKEIKNILFANNIHFIISFNYTETPKKYGFEPHSFNEDSTNQELIKPEKWKRKSLKLHDYKDKNIRTILGNDKSIKTSKSNIISEWNNKANK